MSWQEALRLTSMACLVATAIGFPGPAASQLEWRDAEDWIVSLEKPERLAELQVEKRLAPLNLKPGDIVADIGAGTDVAWFHDVLHAVEKKESLLRNLASYMKPRSRIAITEWVKEDEAALIIPSFSFPPSSHPKCFWLDSAAPAIPAGSNTENQSRSRGR